MTPIYLVDPIGIIFISSIHCYMCVCVYMNTYCGSWGVGVRSGVGTNFSELDLSSVTQIFDLKFTDNFYKNYDL